MKKRVLVMGGSYFIGKKLVEMLLKREYEVCTLNRGSHPETNPAIRQLNCDRNNTEHLKQVLSGEEFDYVVDVSGLDEQQAAVLCEGLEGKQIKKFIFISSSAVYDVDNLTAPYKETDALGENKFWTFYGKNKIKAEKYYREQFQNTRTKLVILRPPYVYGENNYVQRECFLFEHICNHKPVIIPISNPRLQFIYVTDLANIIIELMQKTWRKVSIYNVGNSEGITAKEWVLACAAVANKPVNIIEYDYQAAGRKIRDFFPFYDYDNVLDVTKLHRVCVHETAFERGLQDTFSWYLEEKDKLVLKENVTFCEEEIKKELLSSPVKDI